MFKLINNKKGFLTPFVYFVLVVMSMYLAAFVRYTIDGYFISQRNLRNLQGKYQALRGIEYASMEVSTQGQDWHTHTPVKQGNGYILVPLTEQGQTPNVALTDTCEIDKDGYYSSKDGKFSVMCYISPDSGQHIVYSKSGDSNVYGSKIIFRDLFDYFVFTPSELLLSYITLDSVDSKLGGGIHSNKDIVFVDKAHLLNTAELSTPETIRYFVETYVPREYTYDGMPPGDFFNQYYYWLSNPWVKPYEDAFENFYYRNTNDGHVSGENKGLLMEDPANPGRYINWDPDSGQPIDPNSNPSLYQNAGLISKINGNILPNRLSSAYIWNDYWRLEQDFGQYNWCPKLYASRNYTNSKLQPNAWKDLIQSQELDSIVKEANTGGETITPLAVEDSYYKSESQKNGIYVESLPLAFSVQIGDEFLLTDEGGRIIINDDIVFDVVDFRNTDSTYYNKALVVHVDKMIKNELTPPNGIIFSDNAGIVLDNAKKLPEGGLTTISRKNIYIKGDYNTIDWQPSAAISAGFTYLLSDQFNYPENLPQTFHNNQYPYVEDFVSGKSNWYAQNYQTMANPVNKDYTYVVSIISQDITPHTLERWWYYKKPGDLNNPPSYDKIVEHKRKVIGSLVQLPKDSFPVLGQYDVSQKGTRQRTVTGWPEDMGSLSPKGENNYFSYDEHYLEAGSPKPPGYKVPIHKLTIKLKNEFWNEKKHCQALY